MSSASCEQEGEGEVVGTDASAEHKAEEAEGFKRGTARADPDEGVVGEEVGMVHLGEDPLGVVQQHKGTNSGLVV